jgi:hypothetical protein
MRHILTYRLLNKHRELERQLREELRRPRPDEARVTILKRRKLAVKDELLKLELGLFRAVDA